MFTPIGRVPKNNSDKTRPITDCSRPYGSSLNDHIKRDLVSFRMNSVDNAVLFSSPNCFHSIVDIKSLGPSAPLPLPIDNYKVFVGCSGHRILRATTITWITDSVSVFLAPHLFLR